MVVEHPVCGTSSPLACFGCARWSRCSCAGAATWRRAATTWARARPALVTVAFCLLMIAAHVAGSRRGGAGRPAGRGRAGGTAGGGAAGAGPGAAAVAPRRLRGQRRVPVQLLQRRGGERAADRGRRLRRRVPAGPPAALAAGAPPWRWCSGSSCTCRRGPGDAGLARRRRLDAVPGDAGAPSRCWWRPAGCCAVSEERNLLVAAALLMPLAYSAIPVATGQDGVRAWSARRCWWRWLWRCAGS